MKKSITSIIAATTMAAMLSSPFNAMGQETESRTIEVNPDGIICCDVNNVKDYVDCQNCEDVGVNKSEVKNLGVVGASYINVNLDEIVDSAEIIVSPSSFLNLESEATDLPNNSNLEVEDLSNRANLENKVVSDSELKHNHLKIGSILKGEEDMSKSSIKTIVSYQNTYYAAPRVAIEVKNSPWLKNPINEYELGFESGAIRDLETKIFVNGKIKNDVKDPSPNLNDAKHIVGDYGYAAGLDIYTDVRGLSVRVGMMQDSKKTEGTQDFKNTLGGFWGIDYNDLFKFDLDVWSSNGNQKVDVHGFLGGEISIDDYGGIYMGVGSRGIEAKQANALIGLISDDNKFGFYLESKADWGKEVYGGKLILALNGSAYNKGNYDFKGSLLNDTGMTQFGSDVLRGWAPFDEDAVKKGFAIIIEGSRAHRDANIDSRIAYNGGNFLVSAGVRYREMNKSRFENKRAVREVSALTRGNYTIQKINLDLFGELEVNCRNGRPSGLVGFMYNGNF